MDNLKNAKMRPYLVAVVAILVVAVFGILISKSNAAYTSSFLKEALQVVNSGSFGGGVVVGLDNPGYGLIVHGGRTGLGIDDPSQVLDVNGAGLFRAGGPVYLLDTNHGIKAVSGQGVTIFTYGVDPGIFLQQSTGRVGIGTNSPNAKLSVIGGATTYGIYSEGASFGVFGFNSSNGGVAVYGENTGAGVGVKGASNNASGGIGVMGESSYDYGVRGVSNSNSGVYGSSNSNTLGRAGVVGAGGGTGVYGNGTNYGVMGTSNSIGLYGSGGAGTGVYGTGSTYGVYGVGGSYGGRFSGTTYGIYTSSCYGCSVLAEMVPVSETPNNGDVMCTNSETGKTEICREDKSRYVKGIAQKYAETVMRMGCGNTAADAENPNNGMGIGVMDVDAWQKLPECKGWYPIALSGLSEKTNVVCETPNGKRLGYGDILVSSEVAGRLRPLDKNEDVQAYQIVGRVDTICAPEKEVDSIMVWIQ